MASRRVVLPDRLFRWTRAVPVHHRRAHEERGKKQHGPLESQGRYDGEDKPQDSHARMGAKLHARTSAMRSAPSVT
jgi:hypothetical protein